MKKNILVIDDDPVAQQMIVSLLEAEGHAAVASLNFEDALRRARQTTPDLVLIDVVMPDITGFDACRKIKQMFQPNPPPVIVMTWKLDAVDPVLARKMGADDFVVKTSDYAVLLQAVRKILSRDHD
ncbi:MAG: response regulator transcription factor [Candidatus Omnitrophota bacterium]